MSTHASSTLRELDHRVADGIDVRLLWHPRDDRALVAVSDARTGESFTIGVRDGERALDVFHHPYAYAATRRTLDDTPSGELRAVAA
jgi:hypothetical protein